MRIKVLLCIVVFFMSLNIIAQTDSIQHENGLKRWWNSLVHGNVDRTYERKLDMSFVVAPCYTREGGIGIGGAATALYRLDKTDSIMQPSDFSLSGSASINGIYGITLKGNNNFRGNKARLSYALRFQHKELDFWGVSYNACAINPISQYTKQQIEWTSDYVYKITPNIHVGGAFNINYTNASKVLDPTYLEGQKNTYFFMGLGLSLQYDTRDFILNPKRGIYLMAREVLYPHFMGSYGKTLTATTVIFDFYQPV